MLITKFDAGERQRVVRTRDGAGRDVHRAAFLENGREGVDCFCREITNRRRAILGGKTQDETKDELEFKTDEIIIIVVVVTGRRYRKRKSKLEQCAHRC